MGETQTEHIICHDSGCNAATMAAMMNNRQSDPAVWAALMNNSENSWNNNPFIYLVWMMFANRMWGNNGYEGGENYNSRQIAALQDSVNTNHNNDIALQAINGNRDAMGQLAQTFNCDFGQIQTAICGVKSAIEQVGGQVGYSAESVKNAIALGDSNIIQQMQSCCCQQKELTQRMGYENQIANLQQTNTLTSAISDTRQAVVNGFANLGFQQSQDTAAIINAQTQNTQRILDAMCANTTQALRDQLADKDRQLQTANIIAGLKANGCNCSCGC